MGMTEKRLVKDYLAKNGIGEVPICGFESLKLIGTDGCVYRETQGFQSNTWEREGEVPPSVIFVGTSRHAGGVVLRPLFVLVENVWRNACTGSVAPAWVAAEHGGC